MSTKGVLIRRDRAGGTAPAYLQVYANGALGWVPTVKDAYVTFTDIAALWLFVLPKEDGISYTLEYHE